MKNKLLHFAPYSFLLLCSYLIIFGSCASQENHSETKISQEVLGVKIYDEPSENPQKRNQNKLEGLLIKKADSFYFANNFKQAQTLYEMALNNVTDEETKSYLMQKVARTKDKTTQQK
ncbi:hypothetical protein [Bernardetia sp.]|uniref:hypothetical protein n=1 Tax=Bernardetia sp. TaxID=1937974 RepID=UPI0025C5F8C5|nr:hypothetical protein [Bernardetia sp.]